jgi:hypothetical protein
MRRALLALALLPGAAAAQVTPEEVWQNWQELYAEAGSPLTAERVAREGDILVATGVDWRFDDGEGTRLLARLDRIAFADLGDGTVQVTLPQSYPLTLTLPEEGGSDGPTTLDLTVAQPGHSIRAAGSAEETKYDLSAPELTITLDRVDGLAAADVGVSFAARLADLQAGYVLGGGAPGPQTLASTFAATGLRVDLVAEIEGEDGTGRLSLDLADLTGTTNATVLAPEAMADSARALREGFRFDTGLSFGALAFDVSGQDANGPGRVTGGLEGGSTRLALSDEGLASDLRLGATTLGVEGPDLPAPRIDVSLAAFGMGLDMPMLAGPDPQSGRFLFRLTDLVLPPALWDEAGLPADLPRAPLTAEVEATATGRLFADIATEPRDMAEDVPEGELLSLDLAGLRLSGFGAEVTGSGALTFDNSDLVTWDGIPAPTGTLDFAATGINALLDRAIAAGLVAPDEAMGMRMGLALVTRAVEGQADSLTSRIEFTGTGLLANGQRLR